MGPLSAERAVEELTRPRSIIAASLLVVLFVASSLAGLLLSDALLSSRVGDALRGQAEGLRKTAEESLSFLPLAIYLNNVKVSVLAAILSPLIVPPIVVVILNGLIVGLLLSGRLIDLAFESLGLTPSGVAVVFYGFLAPHGALEIPTIALTAALALEGYRGFLGRLVRRLAVATINLAVAAVVETTLTLAVGLTVLAIVKALGA